MQTTTVEASLSDSLQLAPPPCGRINHPAFERSGSAVPCSHSTIRESCRTQSTTMGRLRAGGGPKVIYPPNIPIPSFLSFSSSSAHYYPFMRDADHAITSFLFFLRQYPGTSPLPKINRRHDQRILVILIRRKASRHGAWASIT